MSKKEIQQKFKHNYITAIQEHLQGMEKQGYVLSQDDVLDAIYLMRFNAYQFRFEVVSSLREAYKHINLEDVPNHFKIVLENYELTDIIADSLTMVNADELYRFTCYEENLDELLPIDELEADLKNYLKICKSLAGTSDKNILDTPQGQGQILAGANVFFTGKDTTLKVSETNKYYRWDKKAGMFLQIQATEIQRILKDLGVDVKKMEVETNMRTVYPIIVTNTTFPVIWNKQKDLQEKIKRDKKAHAKIIQIVNNFE